MFASVSIILCTHRNERYEDFVEAINSLNAQSCENEKLEIVVVVDGHRELYDRILKRYKTLKNKYLNN
jgi:glycosyltransferase involved in cell wall biosynthesis